MATVGDVRQVRDVQGGDGNWDYSSYMRGLYNGLECALAILEDREPAYRDEPPQGYREDRQQPVTDDEPVPG